MSSVGKILQVKKLYGPNEIIFENGTIQTTAYQSGTTFYPEIIDGTTHAVGTQALGIIENGGAQTLFVDQQAKFMLGNPALVETDNVKLDPLFNEVSVGATGNEQVKLRANTNDIQVNIGHNTPNQPPLTNPEKSIYRGNIVSGIQRHANQNPLGANMGWPTSTINLWEGDGMFKCLGGCPFSVGRNFDGLNLPANNIHPKLGDVNLGVDECFGDNQQIRGRLVGPEFNGISIPAEYANDGVLRVSLTADFDWQGAGTALLPNIASLNVEHQRAGVILATWTLAFSETTDKLTKLGLSGERCFFATGANWTPAETWQTDDNFVCYIRNDPATTQWMLNVDIQATYQLYHSN